MISIKREIERYTVRAGGKGILKPKAYGQRLPSTELRTGKAQGSLGVPRLLNDTKMAGGA